MGLKVEGGGCMGIGRSRDCISNGKAYGEWS